MSENYVKKWSSILLNWINCLDIFKQDIKEIAELQDGFCLYSIISYQRSNDDEELCGDQLAAKAAVETFLKGQFPHYESPEESSIQSRGEHGELDAIMQCSLLLHSICMDPNDNKLKKTMCKNLSNRDQKAIFIFSKSMMKHRPITYDEIKNSIYCSIEGNNDSAGLNTSAVLTPPGVRAFQQRETDLRRLRTALDSERFDRCYLQDELKRIQELVDKLGVENEFLKKQLSRPLELNQDDQDKENLPNNNPHTATELKAAEKQITLLRKEKDDMFDRIQDQREQIEAIEEKLEAALSAVSNQGLALEEAEMRAMAAETAVQTEHRNAASLQEIILELQSMMIRNRDPANISVEVDEVDLSRQLPSQSGCNYSFTSGCSTEDLASAVIEVQLRELQAKYANLEEELTNKDNTIRNFENDTAYNEKLLTSLESSLKDKETNIVDSKHLIEEMNETIKKQTTDLEAIKLELYNASLDFQNKLNSQDGEINKYRDENKQLNAKIREFSAKIKDLKQSIAQKDKENQEITKISTSLHDKVAILTEENEKVRNEFQQENSVIKEHFNTLKHEKELIKERMFNIDSRNEMLMQRVEQIQLVMEEKIVRLNEENNNVVASITDKYEHQILLIENERESTVYKLQEEIKNAKYDYEEAVTNLNEVHSEMITSLTASLIEKDKERTKVEIDLKSLIKELKESKQEELLSLTLIKNYEIASVKETLESEILELEKEKEIIISKLTDEIEANRDCYEKELCERNKENIKTVNSLQTELLEKDRKFSNLEVDIQTLEKRLNEIAQNNIELEHIINEQEGKIQSSELQILTLKDEKEITVAKLQNEVKENQNKFENELQMLIKEKIEIASSLNLEKDELRSELETKMLALEKQLQEVLQSNNEDLQNLINRQQDEIAVLKQNFDQQISAVENEKEISVAKLHNSIKDITQNYEEQLQRVEKNQLVMVEKLQKLNLEKNNLVTSITEKYEDQILLLKNDRESVVCKLQEEIKTTKYDYEEAVRNLTEVHSETVTSLTTSLIEKDKQRTKLENDFKTLLKDLEEAKQEELRELATSKNDEIATVRDKLECEILELEREKEIVISKLNIEIKVNSELYDKELFTRNEEHTDTVNSLRNKLLQKDQEQAALEIDMKTLKEQSKEIVQNNEELKGLISEQKDTIQSSQMQILALDDEKKITVTKLQNEIDSTKTKFEKDLQMLRRDKMETVNSLTNDLLVKDELCSKFQINMVALEKQLQEVLQKRDEELQILTNKQQNEIALLKQCFEHRITALKNENEGSVSKLQNEIQNNTEKYEKQLQKLKKDNLEKVNSYSEELLEIKKLQSQLQTNSLDLKKQLEEVMQHKEVAIQNLTKSKDNEIESLRDSFENEKCNIITKLQNEMKYELKQLQEENAEAVNNLQKKDELRLKLENDIKSLRNELDAAIQRSYEELQNLTKNKKDEIASVTETFSELENEKNNIILKLQKENAELTSELRTVIQSKEEETALIKDSYEQQILELEQDNKYEISELEDELNELKTTYTEALLSNSKIVYSLKNELLTLNEVRSRLEANTLALKESISCLNKELLEKDKSRFELESDGIHLRGVVMLKEEDIQSLTKKNNDIENAVSRLEEEKRVLALEYENTVKLLSEDKNEEISHLANAVQILEMEKAKGKEFEKKNHMLEGEVMSLKEKIYNLEELSKSLTIHNKMISDECDSFRDKVSEKEGIITYLEAKSSGLSTANTNLEKNVDALIAKLNDFDKISNEFEAMQNESETKRLKWLQEKLIFETALNTVRQEKESKENKLEILIFEKEKRILEIEKRGHSANLRIKELETLVNKLTDQMESSSARFNSLAKQKDAAIKKLQRRNPTDVDQRVLEVREEYEDKLSRMKNKMLEMFKREKAKHQDDMEVQTKRADRLENKLSNITSELWHTSEKMLNMHHENDWMRKKKSDGKLTLPKVRPERASSAADLRMFGFDTTRDKDIDSASLHSAPPHRSDNNGMHMSDEEGEVFDNAHLAEMQMTPVRNVRGQPPASFNDWKRLSELQRRNSLCPPHLRSSYPAETQFHKPEKFKENDLKMVTNATPLTPLVERHLPKAALPVVQTGPTERRKEPGAGPVYRRPGPPTPSKKGGRLSATSFELRAASTLDSEQSVSNFGRKSSTPSRLRAFFVGSNTAQESATSTPKSRRFSIFKKTS